MDDKNKEKKIWKCDEKIWKCDGSSCRIDTVEIQKFYVRYLYQHSTRPRVQCVLRPSSRPLTVSAGTYLLRSLPRAYRRTGCDEKYKEWFINSLVGVGAEVDLKPTCGRNQWKREIVD